MPPVPAPRRRWPHVAVETFSTSPSWHVYGIFVPTRLIVNPIPREWCHQSHPRPRSPRHPNLFTPANLSILKQGEARSLRLTILEVLCRVPDCQPGDLLAYLAEE